MLAACSSMKHLQSVLSLGGQRTTVHDTYPAVAEILEWAAEPDVPNFRLRKPQLRALETYWYLRLVENTPHIFDLYQSLFTKKKDLFEAFSGADYDLDTFARNPQIKNPVRVRGHPDGATIFYIRQISQALSGLAEQEQLQGVPELPDQYPANQNRILYCVKRYQSKKLLMNSKMSGRSTRLE